MRQGSISPTRTSIGSAAKLAEREPAEPRPGRGGLPDLHRRRKGQALVATSYSPHFTRQALPVDHPPR